MQMGHHGLNEPTEPVGLSTGAKLHIQPALQLSTFNLSSSKLKGEVEITCELHVLGIKPPLCPDIKWMFLLLIDIKPQHGSLAFQPGKKQTVSFDDLLTHIKSQGLLRPARIEDHRNVDLERLLLMGAPLAGLRVLHIPNAADSGIGRE